MLKTLKELIELLEEGSLVVFLFSGHGTEYEGVNYLRSLGMTRTSPEDYKDQTVSLDWIIEKMREGPSNFVNLILLDCYRVNEKNQTFKKSTKGDENRTEVTGCARIESADSIHSESEGELT